MWPALEGLKKSLAGALGLESSKKTLARRAICFDGYVHLLGQGRTSNPALTRTEVQVDTLCHRPQSGAKRGPCVVGSLGRRQAFIGPALEGHKIQPTCACCPTPNKKRTQTCFWGAAPACHLFVATPQRAGDRGGTKVHQTAIKQATRNQAHTHTLCPQGRQ